MIIPVTQLRGGLGVLGHPWLDLVSKWRGREERKSTLSQKMFEPRKSQI